MMKLAYYYEYHAHSPKEVKMRIQRLNVVVFLLAGNLILCRKLVEEGKYGISSFPPQRHHDNKYKYGISLIWFFFGGSCMCPAKRERNENKDWPLRQESWHSSNPKNDMTFFGTLEMILCAPPPMPYHIPWSKYEIVLGRARMLY